MLITSTGIIGRYVSILLSTMSILKTRPVKNFTFLGVLLASSLFASCSGQVLESTAEASDRGEALVIWWEQGYYTQEDEAIESAVEKWEQETGHTVQLSFIDQDTILKETENALNAGNPPDLMYSHRVEETLTPQWAKAGLLADVSDIVEPLSAAYSPTALQAVSLYNEKSKATSIYAVPLNQETVHIHYSKTLLEKAGLSEADIPTEWEAFWSFWQTAQDNLRAQGDRATYALGLPMSSEGPDTYNTFEQVLEAYDVQLLDDQGNLQIDDPQVKTGVINVLKWYTQFYQAGYVPPAAADWRNRDNNIAFLNQELLMVVNPSLSIPGSQREDQEIYTQQIATVAFPNEPDGEDPTYRVSVQQVVAFEGASQQQLAKDFLAYLSQPENIAPYVEGTLGRYFPVMSKQLSESFWNDPADPHISVAIKQFNPENTRPQGHQLNPAYGAVQAENVWGQAIDSIVTDNVSPEAAATDALDRIEVLFT